MGRKSITEYKEEQNSRAKHTYRYWKEHDKDTYECPDCGKPADEIDRLEVHHKDENPLNGDSDNLVGLCLPCHYDRHGKSLPETLTEWKARINDISNATMTIESDAERRAKHSIFTGEWL